MISVNRGRVVLDGEDGMLLKELSFLIGVLQSRMMSRGMYSGSMVSDAVANAVSNASIYSLDDLRIDARMAAAESEQIGNMQRRAEG